MRQPLSPTAPLTADDLRERVRIKIRELVSELEWPIEIRRSEDPVPAITCNPFKRLHIMHMPDRFGVLDALHDDRVLWDGVVFEELNVEVACHSVADERSKSR